MSATISETKLIAACDVPNARGLGRRRRKAAHGLMQGIATASIMLAMICSDVHAQTQPLNLCRASIGGLQKAYTDGSTTPDAVVRWYKDRIEKIDRNGPRLNAVPLVLETDTNPPAAHTAAPGTNKRLLHGVPIVIKDMIDVAGAPTSAGDPGLMLSPAAKDAPVISRLRGAGAIILGKSSVSGDSYPWLSGFGGHGLTRNPFDANRDPQGSSTGSGVAVAADLATVAIGEETTDSLRGVADAMGLVAMRPTPGRVPDGGVFPFSRKTDVLGPMARTVADAAIVLEAIDDCGLTKKGCGYRDALAGNLAGKRFAVPRMYIGDGNVSGAAKLEFDPETLRLFNAAITAIRGAGAEVVLVDSPGLSPTDARLELTDDYYRKWGFPVADTKTLEAAERQETALVFNRYLADWGNEGVGSIAEYLAVLDPVERRDDILAWAFQAANLRALTYPDPASVKALLSSYDAAIERMYKTEIHDTLRKGRFDGFLFPTAFRPPLTVVDAADDPQGYDGENVLAYATVDFGLPTITVPMGFTKSGLPATLTIMGDRNQDRTVIALAAGYERNSKLPQSPLNLCDGGPSSGE
jgi:amidase